MSAYCRIRSYCSAQQKSTFGSDPDSYLQTVANDDHQRRDSSWREIIVHSLHFGCVGLFILGRQHARTQRIIMPNSTSLTDTTSFEIKDQLSADTIYWSNMLMTVNRDANQSRIYINLQCSKGRRSASLSSSLMQSTIP